MQKKEKNILLIVFISLIVLIVGIVAFILLANITISILYPDMFKKHVCWETTKPYNGEDTKKKDIEDESGNVVGYITEKEYQKHSKISKYRLEFIIDGYEKSIYEFTAPKGLINEINLYDDRCQLKKGDTTLSFSTRVNFGVDDDASDVEIENNRILYRSMTTEEIVNVLSKSYEEYDDLTIKTKDDYFDIIYTNEEDGYKFITCVRVFWDNWTSVVWVYGTDEYLFDDSAKDWIDKIKYTITELHDFSDY